MKAFDDLIETARTLNGPDGCPWDHTQNFESLKRYVIEEAHEVIEAVDEGDMTLLVEELGDLLYTVVFYAMIAEKKGAFTLEAILTGVREKLIRRHPHVFGDAISDSIDEVIARWEAVKKEEKPGRTSALDGIPKTLDLLIRAEKMVSRMRRAGFTPPRGGEGIGDQILSIVAESEGAEAEVRRALRTWEKSFREWEVLE